MCVGCVKEYLVGSPVSRVTETMTETAQLIAEWYSLAGNEVTGGILHVVVDDYNLDDVHVSIEHLRTYVAQHAAEPNYWAKAEAILERLSAMTIGERGVTVHLGHGDPLEWVLSEA